MSKTKANLGNKFQDVGGNYPSTTGNPSGKGRGNNPPKSGTNQTSNGNGSHKPKSK